MKNLQRKKQVAHCNGGCLENQAWKHYKHSTAARFPLGSHAARQTIMHISKGVLMQFARFAEGMWSYT
jgi:hypothetical protein